jgi:hypothetical protein
MNSNLRKRLVKVRSRLPAGRRVSAGMGIAYSQAMNTSPRLLVAFTFLAIPAIASADDDFERAPINYSKSKPNNPIERLQEKIDAGNLHLPFHEERGYLPAVLKGMCPFWPRGGMSKSAPGS